MSVSPEWPRSRVMNERVCVCEHNQRNQGACECLVNNLDVVHFHTRELRTINVNSALLNLILELKNNFNFGIKLIIWFLY